jgi:ABC-type lipoprotein export system ATPase subunit
MTKFLLETINLKKTFDHKNGLIELFNNVNVKIKRGDLIALVGPSGSGKSSFLHLLALLDEPSKGKILLKNKDTVNFNEIEKNQARKENISIIFQGNNLLTDFTALENVMMPLIIKGEKNEASSKKAIKILKDVKILNRVNHFPNELSGGEQQRVAIARALISETDLILADEPTGNLDYKTTKDIFSYFIKLKKLNKAVVFATHNRELANKADYKLSILNGNIKRVNAK